MSGHSELLPQQEIREPDLQQCENPVHFVKMLVPTGYSQ